VSFFTASTKNSHRRPRSSSKWTDEDITALAREVEQAETTQEQARLIIIELQATLSNLQDSVATLQAEKNDLATQLEFEKEDRRRMGAEKAYLESEVRNEKAERQKAVEEKEAVQRELRQLERNQTRLKDDVDKYKDLNDVREEFVRRQLDSGAINRVQLQRSLEQAEVARDAALRQAKELQEKLRQSMDRCRSLESHNDELIKRRSNTAEHNSSPSRTNTTNTTPTFLSASASPVRPGTAASPVRPYNATVSPPIRPSTGLGSMRPSTVVGGAVR